MKEQAAGVFLFALQLGAAWSACTDGKMVLLWSGSPFGWPGGPVNQTKLQARLNATEKLKDVVDVMAPVSFTLASPSSASINTTGGLIEAEGASTYLAALKAQGFRVEPWISPSDTLIDTYRHYFHSEAFRVACVNAVTSLGLDGLNFDFEPSDCDKQPAGGPCSEKDATDFAQMLSNIQSDLHGKGPRGTDARVSVDSGQSILAKDPTLKNSTAGLSITMSTYYGTSDFDIALPRDLELMGPERFGLGVCPSCHVSNASDIAHRMGMATQLGVCNIGFFSGVDLDNNTIPWWAAIRKWKAVSSLSQGSGIFTI